MMLLIFRYATPYYAYASDAAVGHWLIRTIQNIGSGNVKRGDNADRIGQQTGQQRGMAKNKVNERHA